jgi:hypothetical protein
MAFLDAFAETIGAMSRNDCRDRSDHPTLLRFAQIGMQIGRDKIGSHCRR